MNKKFPLLSDEQLMTLRYALNFLHVSELRNLCVKLQVIDTGAKGILVNRIVYFIETGEILAQPKTPKVSCAQRGKVYPLSADTLMLKGAYKNDLKTRLFFKHLIGDYFHFTAFGIDWLNERWMKGNPPTYQEFVDMWCAEYARRKQYGTTPKEEWAYITFVQQFGANYPDAPRLAIMDAWEAERTKQVKLVHVLLRSI